jgi:hypothetical protein
MLFKALDATSPACNTQEEAFMQTVMLVRDIFIIILALMSIIVGILMVLLILEIRNLINTLQRDVKPILDSVNETASTVKGTTAFVSDKVVRPVAGAVGAIAGARQAVSTMVGRETSAERRWPGGSNTEV